MAAVTTTVALMLSCAAFTAGDMLHHRSFRAEQLSALAKMLGSNVSTALEFGYADQAADLLDSVREQPWIELVRLCDARGGEFATYPRGGPDDDTDWLANHGRDGIYSNGANIYVVHTIRSDGEKLGVLHMHGTTKDLPGLVIGHILIAALVLLVSLAVSMLLASRLQRLLTRPILTLADAMRRISTKGDYSVRVEEHGNDELGVLCDGFNDMLRRVDEARKDLQDANEQLENRVASRTAQLEMATKAAVSASQAKTDFLANMSHEIRTPMTAILGFADLLGDDDLPASQRRECIDTIQRNGNHLLTVINDILDLSKIEAGEMEVEISPCSPRRIVEEIAAMMRAQAEAKGLSLDVECHLNLPHAVSSDAFRLRQILVNLVGNAVKFTERGGVRVVVRPFESQTPADCRLAFDVIDTGVGMSAEDIKAAFDPFQQADYSSTRKHGGTGLGLAISRRFAKLLRGKITVSSLPGHGSTFTLTIEAEPEQKAQPQAADEKPQSSRDRPPTADAKESLSGRILLVEDGPDNQRLISSFLDKAGAEVVIAENGQVAVDKTREAELVNEPFGLILMDMQMPVLDGYAATRLLRRDGFRRPIVALTAHAMKGDHKKCLDVGCDDYCSKPVGRAALVRLAAKYLNGQIETCPGTRL